MMKRGIDVSVFQRKIDWAAVRASGTAFAMVKATQGRSERNAQAYLFTDPYFSENMAGAAANGLNIGVYHYLTAATEEEAEQEADYFLSVIARYRKSITLYAAVDVESGCLPRDRVLLTEIVRVFNRAVKNAGYDSAVYTNPDFLRNRLDGIGDAKLWLALWRDKTIVPSGDDYPNLTIWQYGSEAVNGIDGNVDVNYMLWEQREEDTMNENDNRDSIPAEWAREAVEWARARGILRGDETGNLMLSQPVTREQLCVFLHRLYKILNHDISS
ncbi:MAG: GH25 family lysozyme [Eubacteriales bacterium]